MKVKQINLDDEGLPETLTVEMTREEAILITSHFGSVTPTTETTSSVWRALSRVFNAFWDDGVYEARYGEPRG
jgi:hypothetical protein